MLGGSAILLGLKGFIGSPSGRAAILFIAFLGWTAYQRADATSDAREALAGKVNTATRVEHDRLLAAARKVADDARLRADVSDARATRIKGERDAIVSQINTIEGGDCDIPDDVRQRLLRIGH